MNYPSARTVADVARIIGDHYPELTVDAEICRDGVLAELVVSCEATGRQALVTSEYDLYRWFGFPDTYRPPVPVDLYQLMLF